MSRLQPAFDAAVITSLLPAAYALFVLSGSAPFDHLVLPIVGVPFSSSILLICLAVVYPGLVADKLRFPLNLTLPAVHCCLMPACSVLMTTQPGLVSAEKILYYSAFWQMPQHLALAFGLEALVLTAFTMGRR